MPKLSAYTHDLDYSYAPGIFPSHEALKARPECVRRLLVHSQGKNSEGVESLIALCAKSGVRVEEADHALQRISKKENCFAAAVFDKFQCTLDGKKNHVVLHHPSDMGNLGTILRTCLGFGLTELAIIRPAADVFDPRVVRSSMGAIFSMHPALFDSFEEYRQQYPQHALYPFMLDGSMPLQTAAEEAKAPYALIFGNEATGLPKEFSTYGQAVRIVHGNQIDSLNLGVAVSIAAYAFTQKDFVKK